MLLEGKVAIVSGVGPGMGRDIALCFAREGADVALAARTEATLTSVAVEVEALGRRALQVPTDITSAGDCTRLVQRTTDELGPIDVLSNNAYTEGRMAPTDELDIDDWREPIETNLLGTLQLTRRVVEVMKAHGGGSIVMTSSMIVRRVLPTMVNYAASKAALLAATQGMARELGGYGIRLNSVLPGYIWGETLEGYFKAQAAARGVDPQLVYDEVAAEIALGRIPHSSEIAEAVLFFASELASVVTGQTLDVNGGHVMA